MKREHGDNGMDRAGEALGEPEWAGAGAEPVNAGLLEFLAEQVDRRPGATALEIPANDALGRTAFTLSYVELWTRAGLLAERITGALGGAAPSSRPFALNGDEHVVALYMSRADPGLMCAHVACLMAGAPSLPIDPKLPGDHAKFLASDAAVEVVVTETERAADAESLFSGPTCIHGDWALPFDGEEAASRALEARRQARTLGVPPSRLAYVIYTSGTTGRPKGVAVEYGSISALVSDDAAYFGSGLGLGPSDRIGQGSSPSYDSFLEEVWLAFALGGTVVVIDDDVLRQGPDLVEWLRRERLTVLCPPPTLLRTLGRISVGEELPDLRLLYVGGEALPADIARAFGGGSQGRGGPRLVNGYGPTECTVTVMRSEVHDPSDVRIGRAVGGSQAHAVRPDGSRCDTEEHGELWISGASLARGYIGQPQLTAERFVEHPLHGRCYRTGDLVSVGGDGEFAYHGRIDSQVQVRGHRVELEAVESWLARQPGVTEAACALEGPPSRQRLVAWLVGPADTERPSLSAIRGALLDVIPEAMVPSEFEWARELPRAVGGKLDRRSLPDWSARLQGKREATEPVDDPVLQGVLEAIQSVLALEFTPGNDADFFDDLGGDSLAVALLVSELRVSSSAAGLAVRDVYERRTPRDLAALLGEQRSLSKADGAAAPASTRTAASYAQRVLFTLAQTAWIAGELLLAAALLRWVVLPASFGALGLASPWVLLMVAMPSTFAVAAALLPLQALLVLLVRGIVLPRYEPGRYPAFGSFHLRHWVVSRTAGWLPFGLVRGTRLFGVLLRMLGAHVGAGVHVHRGVSFGGGWNLIRLEDGAMLEQEASLRAVDLDAGELVVGMVTVRQGASLAVRAAMAPGTELGAGARLGALGVLETGSRVPGGELWQGTPAVKAGPVAPQLGSSRPADSASARGRTDFGVVGGGMVQLWARSLVGILVLKAGDGWIGVNGFPELALMLCAALVVDLLVVGLWARWLGRRVARSSGRAAIFGSHPGAFVAAWHASGLTHAAGRWLSGSLFWPMWLRLAGMSIGRGSEVSSIVDTVPSEIALGRECFLADGVYLGGASLHGGFMVRGRTRVGSETFIGNHAVLTAGTSMPDGVLIGVCTPIEHGPESSGAWFGQPPFRLPRQREVAFDRNLTHEPSLLRRVNRLTWEGARLLIPALFVLLAWLWLTVLGVTSQDSVHYTFRSVLLAGLAAGGASVYGGVALKWILLGRVKPGRHALWSCWCSRWDFHYVVWGALTRPALARFEGTLLMSVVLRLTGMRIGPGVLLGRGFAHVVDPDMLDFRAGSTVAGLFQAHTFEDRVLKIDRLEVGEGATLGSGALAFYGVKLGGGSRIRPGGVALKGEALSEGVDYVGVPVRPVARR